MGGHPIVLEMVWRLHTYVFVAEATDQWAMFRVSLSWIVPLWANALIRLKWRLGVYWRAGQPWRHHQPCGVMSACAADSLQRLGDIYLLVFI